MAYQPKPGWFSRSGRTPPQQNRNARSALGEPRAQLVYYGVWIGGIVIAILLFLLFVVLIGNNANALGEGKRNIQTGRENQGPEVAPVAFTTDGKVVMVEKWLTDMQSADQKVKQEAQHSYNGALARGQANFQRICIGCHYGPPEATSNGPWLGNLYQTAALYNGKPLNDANVVTFILLGSQSHNLTTDGTAVRLTKQDGPLAGGWNPMPAGIATPQQAVDIMLYLKQQTSKK
ncbi:MAG TPA: hypothetical protein VH186_38080 [Chloroflexia bacterium]|nr:hypothetical protein [Chloroflexia bacterium]